MINKKNIAIAMAAATVAMPMTQSFAAVVNSDETQAIKDMKANALDLLNKEFTEKANLLATPSLAGEKVFNVSIQINDGDEKGPYKSYAEFERAFDSAYNDLREGDTIKVNYNYNKDTAYNTLADGTVVDYDTSTYDQTDLKASTYDATDKDSNVPIGEIQFKINEYSKEKTYEIRLSDGKELTNGEKEKRFLAVKVGDTVIDATKPILRQDANKENYVDIDGDPIAKVNSDDKVEFDGTTVTINDTKYADAVIDGFYAKQDGTLDLDEITSDVIKKSSTETKLNSSELFKATEGRLTEKGNAELNRIQEFKEDIHNDGYTVKVTEPSVGQELKIVVEKKGDKDAKPKKVEEIRIAKDAADKKGEAYKAIKELVLSKDFDADLDDVNYADKIMTAAGADRYATAAQVSRKAFPTADGLKGEKAVVLVTGEQDKLVDGLTATPLAASLNGGAGAPVLLTGNAKLAQPVIDEIKRLDAEKVYIVGGAISTTVENELKKVHGMEVERVSGEDRYDTSIEVANEIYEDHMNGATDFANAFVVGGRSEADALSAGAAAARDEKVAPILLTNEDKLTKDVKHFLEGSKMNDNAHVYVVGGNISKAAYSDISDAKKTDTVKRLAGDDRQDTNAKVIDEFFTGSDNVVVAKSDNKGMVDALGAGVYAGKMNAPVVLATNSLTQDQEDALNKMTVDNANNKINKLQVGEGIASAVAKFIKNL